MPVAHLDAETYSPVDLKSAGLSRYITHPDADVICLAYALDDEEPRLWLPGDPYPDVLDRADTSIAFNAGFERAVWGLLELKYDWPACPPVEKWVCAQAVALSYAMPGSLEHATDALGIEERKDPRGQKLIQMFCKPNKKLGRRMLEADAPQDFYDFTRIYCPQDVRAERAMLHALPTQRLSAEEQRRWQQQMTINERGFRVDIPTTRLIARNVQLCKERLIEEGKQLTGGLKPTQRDAVLGWLRDRGEEVPDMKKRTLLDLAASMPPDDVARVIEIRQAVSKVSTQKYNVILRTVSGDSRIRYTQTYHGAGTGRVTHRQLQPGNMPRGELKDYKGEPWREVYKLADEVGLVSDLGLLDIMFDPMTFYSALVRSMIVASPGNLLFAGDYAQIEARMNAYQSDDAGRLAAFENGADLYKKMASRIYGIPVDQISKESRERQVGKSAELGAGFGLGWAGFKVYCKDQAGLELEDEEAQQAIEVYREESPCIQKNWYRVKDATLGAISDPGKVYEAGLVKYVCTPNRKWLFAKLPSGRVLSYCRPRIERDKFGRWEQIIVAGVHPKTKKWTENLRAWHGQFVNNNVQGTCRDIMAAAMLRVEDEGFPVVLSVHDEVIADAHRDESALPRYVEIMAAPIPWAPGLPMKVDAWCGKRYRKG